MLIEKQKHAKKKKMDMGHVAITHHGCTIENCNICDGGLFVCKYCGRAEAELDEPCQPVLGQAREQKQE
jgi:hypothetical protein